MNDSRFVRGLVGTAAVVLLVIGVLAWLGSHGVSGDRLMASIGEGAATLTLGLGMIAGAVWLYLLPAWVASRRQHRNRVAILAANLTLGWTGIGWALCLVWALMA